jgi:hypothetical protein
VKLMENGDLRTKKGKYIINLNERLGDENGSL